MIDEACGYDPANPPVSTVVLIRCPKCKKEKHVVLDKSDPPSTSVVEACCPECAGDFEEIRYFDAAGKELVPQ
jgi:hypothetical protein